MLPDQKPVWPQVVGILSIVLGSLAVLQGCFGVLGAIFVPELVGLSPVGGAQMQSSMRQLLPWSIAAQIGTAALGVVNLTAGVWLVQRRVRGVSWLRAWAIAKLLFAPLSAMVGYFVQAEMMKAAPQGTAGPSRGLMAMFVMGGMTVGVLWAWAYPVTALVWLSRPGVRAHVRELEGQGAGTMDAGGNSPEP